MEERTDNNLIKEAETFLIVFNSKFKYGKKTKGNKDNRILEEASSMILRLTEKIKELENTKDKVEDFEYHETIFK